MRGISFRLSPALAAAFVLALPASSALAGDLTLRPSGFGAHSYAAWKAQQGEPDSSGSSNQALYFQKMTPTPTFAAGVAVIDGIAGTPASELTGLSWDHREDGHCGAGAPRWNVGFSVGGGPTQTIFLGCASASHDDSPPPASGHDWCRDEQPSPATLLPPNATITSLAIVFDEGNDTPNPPPAGCDQEQPAGGFGHLDNITVEVDGAPHVWTSARDNGN
ncbi:MAG TPA: hypothetical protein VF712_17945 [Thermoleophilaceae bacterium]|jgi:hypothetical protein